MAPWRARASLHAQPMPREPPVTRAIRPSSRNMAGLIDAAPGASTRLAAAVRQSRLSDEGRDLIERRSVAHAQDLQVPGDPLHEPGELLVRAYLQRAGHA